MNVSRLLYKLSPSWSSLVANGNAGTTHRFGTDQQIPERIDGRHVYLMGFLIYATVQFDKVMATMGGAMAGELFPTVFRNIHLRAHGHSFWKELDGLDLRRDVEMRVGNYIEAVASDEADADETDGTQAITQEWWCTNPALVGTPRELEGAIPVALLNSKKNPENGLEFTIAQNFDQFAGIAIDGLSAFQMYAICGVAGGRDLRIPSEWQVYAYHSKEPQPPLAAFNGRCEYFIVSPRRDDAAAYGFDLSGFSGVEAYVQAPGAPSAEYVLRNFSAEDIARKFITDRFGTIAALSTNAQAMSTSAPPYLPILYTKPGAQRSEMPAGQLALKWGTFDSDYDAEGVRYLARVTGRHSAPRLDAWGRAMGFDLVGRARRGEVGYVGAPNSIPADVKAILDLRVAA